MAVLCRTARPTAYPVGRYFVDVGSLDKFIEPLFIFAPEDHGNHQVRKDAESYSCDCDFFNGRGSLLARLGNVRIFRR